MNEWFKARNIWYGAFNALSDAEAGRLAKAVWTYTTTGEEVELSGNEKGCYAMIIYTLRMDEAHDSGVSDQRRIAGLRSAEKRKQQIQQMTTNAEFSQQNQQTPTNQTIKNKNKEDIKETILTDRKEKSAALDRAFDKFWACYPRHTAKQDAKRAFIKVSPDDALFETMLTAIQRQKQTDQWSDPRYIPHPATWLNGRRWEDEAAAPKQAPVKQVSAQQYTQRNYDEDELEKRLGVNDLFREVAG